MLGLFSHRLRRGRYRPVLLSRSTRLRFRADWVRCARPPLWNWSRAMIREEEATLGTRVGVARIESQKIHSKSESEVRYLKLLCSGRKAVFQTVMDTF